MQTEHRTHLSLKEKQRKEREALILTTAEEVFFEKGYHETSMEEIATRVGIAKGTVYLHFPGKEDLVIAIFERDMRSLLQEIDAIINSDKYATPRTKLEAVLYFMHTGLFSRQAQLLSTIYSGVDLKRKIMERGCSIRNHWESVVTRVAALLEQGKTAGEFDKNIPTRVMVMAIFGIFSPKSYHNIFQGDDLTPDELAKHLIRTCFCGIATHA